MLIYAENAVFLHLLHILPAPSSPTIKNGDAHVFFLLSFTTTTTIHPSLSWSSSHDDHHRLITSWTLRAQRRSRVSSLDWSIVHQVNHREGEASLTLGTLQTTAHGKIPVFKRRLGSTTLADGLTCTVTYTSSRFIFTYVFSYQFFATFK